MILTCYTSNIVMTATIKKWKFKQSIQGMFTWTEHQRDKGINLKKESHRQRRNIYSRYTKSDWFLCKKGTNGDSDSEEDESSDTHWIRSKPTLVISCKHFKH